jgi:catechol 2,3-dioxygenase-like lactoylglutathione lyase family enzyme
LRIARSILRIGDPERSLAFYTGALGMTLVQRDEEAGEAVFRLAYPSAQAPAPAELELRHRPAPRPKSGPASSHGGKSSYWKIGITLADVDRARARLCERGVRVSEPAQFEDIGYLCHLADPDGYDIELLQHRFAANYQPVPLRDDLALGSTATLGQVSLRVKNATAALRFYVERVGLTLLSRQPVPRHRFTLYFLSACPEPPPDPDLEAVANREWLWQRPYTTLELQHRWGAEADAAPWARLDEKTLGFAGVVVECGERPPETLRDPDGNRIIVAPPPA